MRDWSVENGLIGKGRRWYRLVATIVFSGIAVVPGIDQSLVRFRELGQLRARLAEREALPQRARALEERVEQLQNETAPLESVLVHDTQLSLFKQDVNRMVRTAKCRLRSNHPGAASRRTLDETLGRPSKQRMPSGKTKGPQWQVDAQVSSISVQGSFPNIVTFLSALDREHRALRITAMHLHSPVETTDEIILDLQIQTISLVRG